MSTLLLLLLHPPILPNMFANFVGHVVTRLSAWNFSASGVAQPPPPPFPGSQPTCCFPLSFFLLSRIDQRCSIQGRLSPSPSTFLAPFPPYPSRLLFPSFPERRNTPFVRARGHHTLMLAWYRGGLTRRTLLLRSARLVLVAPTGTPMPLSCRSSRPPRPSPSPSPVLSRLVFPRRSPPLSSSAAFLLLLLLAAASLLPPRRTMLLPAPSTVRFLAALSFCLLHRLLLP